jgi:hypothetical protein
MTSGAKIYSVVTLYGESKCTYYYYTDISVNVEGEISVGIN